MTEEGRSVSLVLGSGGARGLAHIGVIAELEARGYRIASIAGCSIGALIGGIYAAGKLDAYTEWVSDISKLDMVALLDLAWQNDGLVKGDKIINKLVDLVGDQRIEDLPIPFTAVATDITNGTEVWMSSGRLFDAVRASISLPLFFTPFEYRNAKLIDGGCLNPVPIAPTWRDETDLTIAVNLGGEPEVSRIYGLANDLLDRRDCYRAGSLETPARLVHRRGVHAASQGDLGVRPGAAFGIRE